VKILAPVTGCEKVMSHFYQKQIVFAEINTSSFLRIANFLQVICVGLNYKDHCAEQNAPLPEEPLFFSKFPSSIVGGIMVNNFISLERHWNELGLLGAFGSPFALDTPLCRMFVIYFL